MAESFLVLTTCLTCTSAKPLRGISDKIRQICPKLWPRILEDSRLEPGLGYAVVQSNVDTDFPS